MPYLNKRHLERVVMDAFNTGIIEAMSVDHTENNPEMIFNSLDFDEFYHKHFKKDEEV